MIALIGTAACGIGDGNDLIMETADFSAQID
jgi:hypothetical protein